MSVPFGVEENHPNGRFVFFQCCLKSYVGINFKLENSTFKNSSQILNNLTHVLTFNRVEKYTQVHAISYLLHYLPSHPQERLSFVMVKKLSLKNDKTQHPASWDANVHEFFRGRGTTILKIFCNFGAFLLQSGVASRYICPIWPKNPWNGKKRFKNGLAGSPLKNLLHLFGKILDKKFPVVAPKLGVVFALNTSL